MKALPFFASGFLIAAAIPLLYLMCLSANPAHVACISTDQYGEYWPEVGIYLGEIVLGIAAVGMMLREG